MKVENLTGSTAGDLLRCPTLPLPASGGQEWKCEFRAPHSPGRLLEVAGSPLGAGPNGPGGWALTLKDLGEVLSPPKFVGRSPAVQELLEFVSRIAASSAKAILLLGESGTGKELIAQRLHGLSRRASAPFVAINCAAIPENLLESELFGFERGAFTDARAPKEGLLEKSHGGTVFLDEIADLSLPMQAKLLRVLENHTFRRIGGSRDIAVDLRVIGATNQQIEKAIANRTFRSDLYYRLNGVQIQLPPLRERREDIREIAAHFLHQFNRLHHRQIQGIHPSAQRILELYPWPGNVRELRNVIERAVLVEPSHLLMPASLAIPGRTSDPDGKPPCDEIAAPPACFSLHSSEQELIAAALAEADGNQTRAAILLGIGRYSLRYRMKKLGIL